MSEATDNLRKVRQYLGEIPHDYDETDAAIVSKRTAARDGWHTGRLPKSGDWVRFPDGELRRVAYCWDDSAQPASAGGGSYYLTDGGGMSHSGGLDPSIPFGLMKPTAETLPGRVWIFHHGFSGAGRAVYTSVPCRVFTVHDVAKHERAGWWEPVA